MASRKEACLSDFGSAADAVRCVLLAALPPDVPPSFRDITSASFIGTGRSRKAVAHLVMFDGLPATAEVSVGNKMGGYTVWSHRWTEMSGGACSWEGDRWLRCDEGGNVLPNQMTLPLPCITLFSTTADQTEGRS